MAKINHLTPMVCPKTGATKLVPSQDVKLRTSLGWKLHAKAEEALSTPADKFDPAKLTDAKAPPAEDAKPSKK